MASLSVHLFDLKLARLPDHEVENISKRRSSGLLLEINVEVLEHHGYQLCEAAVAARDAVAARRIYLECGAHVQVPD